ncbi:MAG: hypothetical protein U0M08_04530 [Clostridia bacterium]|nr:hypothetical protein [Clostridia bacterium]
MPDLELPLGFGMALAQNEAAMKKFESLSSDEKESIICRAKNVGSKAVMHALVDSLV